MKSFLYGVWLGVKALVSRPVQYITDPIQAVENVYKEELVEKGFREDEITKAVEEYHKSGGIIYEVYEAGKKGLQRLSSLLGFSVRNIAVIIVVALVAVGAFWLWRNGFFSKVAQNSKA